MTMPLLKNKSRTLFLVVIALLTYGSQCHAELKVGDTFPDLTAQKLEGELPAKLKGKIVFVDFWASWCVPCASSFPVLDNLQKRYPDRLVIVAISVDEKPAKMQAFLKKHPVSFAVVRDAEHKLADLVDVQAMPTSFLLDGEGKVRFMHSGFHAEESQKKYTEEIESLLKGKP